SSASPHSFEEPAATVGTGFSSAQNGSMRELGTFEPARDARPPTPADSLGVHSMAPPGDVTRLGGHASSTDVLPRKDGPIRQRPGAARTGGDLSAAGS